MKPLYVILTERKKECQRLCSVILQLNKDMRCREHFKSINNNILDKSAVALHVLYNEHININEYTVTLMEQVLTMRGNQTPVQYKSRRRQSYIKPHSASYHCLSPLSLFCFVLIHLMTVLLACARIGDERLVETEVLRFNRNTEDELRAI